LVRDVQSYVSENILAIADRSDLHPVLESLIGDCCGQGSVWDLQRQHLSCYGWDHFGDCLATPFSQDQAAEMGLSPPGSVRALLRSLCDMRDLSQAGPILDIGCGCGRTTLDLALSTEKPVVGIDLQFPLLRLASQVLRTGSGRFPLRHTGVVYRDTPIVWSSPLPDNVDFWVANSLEPPFSNSLFSECFGLNVLDAVSSPAHLFVMLDRLLQPNGVARLSCPYDWSSLATPAIGWIGGHSQRAVHGGDGPTVLRNWLGTQRDINLRIFGEKPRVPWVLRLHSRSAIHYTSHLLCLEKMPSLDPTASLSQESS
jgi:SAM-dependent methyltransferase